MEKQQLRKNRLDLEFHGEAQKTNAYLILLTTGILGFAGTFIWLKDAKFFYLGIVMMLLVSGLGVSFYQKSSQRMKEILDEIEQLESNFS